MDPLDRHFRDSLADLSESSSAIAQLGSDKSAWWWSLFESQAMSLLTGTLSKTQGNPLAKKRGPRKR